MSAEGAGPLILMYHRVGKPSRRSPVNGQYVNPAAFARQMRLLKILKTPVVPLTAVAGHARGTEQLSPQHLAITFDDGFANLHENAAPVLAEHRFPYMVFLISDYLGRLNEYHPPEKELYEPLLSLEQIQEMRAQGASFGSHTRRHARLTECAVEEQADQIRGSRQVLTELLQEPVTTFCYPYGAHDDGIRQQVVDAGYQLACSTLKGRNDRGQDPYRLRRINVRADTSLPVFFYKLVRARTVNR